jgi:hypothetical protein
MGAEESPCTATPHDGGSDKTGQALWRGNWLLTNHLTRKRRRKLCKDRPSAHVCVVAVLIILRIPTWASAASPNQTPWNGSPERFGLLLYSTVGCSPRQR